MVGITREGVEVRTGEGVNMVLAHGDRMLSRLGLAYAINMHQAQGMTTDQGIGVMHSTERHLSSQRLTHVMATRVRDDIEIFTNDRDLLLRTIDANPGDKASALDQVSTKFRAEGGVLQGPESSAAAPMLPNERSDPFGIDPSTMRSKTESKAPAQSPQRSNVPEKTIELGL